MSKTTIKKESAVDYLYKELQASETKEDFLMAFWIYWVENVTIRTRDFQKVLASSSVNKWFITELQKEEAEFRLLTSRYPEIKGAAKDMFYCECINKLMSRFPKALLDQAQKREQKPQATKVPGHKIELSILYQN